MVTSCVSCVVTFCKNRQGKGSNAKFNPLPLKIGIFRMWLKGKFALSVEGEGHKLNHYAFRENKKLHDL